MTTEEIVYAIWRKLEGGFIPDDTRYTYRELRLHVRGALAEALKQDYFAQLNADEFRYVGDSISVRYKAAVSVNPDTGLKTITIPATQINVPSSLRNLSITSLNPVSLFATKFIPVRAEEVFVGQLQPPIPCAVLYYQTGKNIEFYNAEFDDESVMVTQKYALPKDDKVDLGIPEEALPNIIKLVEQQLNPQRASDRDNNGVPIN